MSPRTPTWRAVRVCIFLLVTASSAVAEPAVASPAPLPDASFSVLRVFGALLFVVALFLAGVWSVRRWQVLRPGGSRSPRLQILEARSLGGRQSLFVVGYEKQRLLLGTSPAGVQLLTRLPDSDGAEPEVPAPPSFATALEQLMARRQP